MATTNITLGFISGVKVFTETDLENTAISVQASSTTIYEIEIDNVANAAQDNYVKFWNTAGAVTVGTTVPDMVIEVNKVKEKAETASADQAVTKEKISQIREKVDEIKDDVKEIKKILQENR